jgi:hypothetical protein
MTTGTLVRTVGFNSSNTGQHHPMGKRAVFTLSDGTRLVVIADPNQTGVSGDGGDNTGVAKFYVYTCPAGAQSPWTLRATVTPTTAPVPNRLTWTAAIGENNNVHIAWRGGTGGIYYRRVTYAAGPAYTVQAEETVLAGPPANGNTGYIRRMDMDVAGSGDNAVIVAYAALTASAVLANRRCELRAFTRTSTPAWVAAPTTPFTSAGQWYYLGTEDVTCAADKAGPDGSNNITVMAAVSRKRNDGADLGAVLFRIATNTGTGTATVTFITPTSLGSLGFGYGNSSGQILLNLYSTANNEWTMMIGLAWSPPKIGVWRFTMAGSVKTDLIALQSYTWTDSDLQRLDGWHWMHCSFGNDTALFGGVGTNGLVYTVPLQFFRTPSHRVRYGAFSRWMEGENFGGYGGWSSYGTSGNKHLSLNHHGSLWYGKANNFKILYKPAELPNSPAFVVPAASSTITTDRPGVAAEHRWSATNHPQVRTKMQWQLASDAGFTTNLRDFTELDTDFVLAHNTASPNNARVSTSEVLPTLAELFQGTWYIRARAITELGDLGAWSAAQAFVVSHPPVPTNQYPKNDVIFSYGGAGAITFTWKFTDPSPYDLQTAYQINVEDVETETMILDTGKVLSTVQTATHNIPAAGKDVLLRWRVSLWDSDDVQGPPSSYATFYTVDVPGVTVDYPSVATTNVLTTDDRGFDATIGSWIAAWNANTPVRSTGQFRTGPASLQATATGAGSAAVGTGAALYPCFPGQEITAQAWSRANTTGRQVQAVLQFYDNTSTYLGSGTDVFGLSTADNNAGWTQVPLLTAFAPVNAAFYRVAVQRVAAAAGESWFIDDVVSGDTGNISTGAPVVSWTTTIGGGRYQTHYRVLVLQADVIKYDSGWVLSGNTQHQIPLGYMVNSTTYTFRVVVKDNLGLESSGEQTATTSFVVPAAPSYTVSIASFSTDGYVRLAWTNAVEDPDFVSYNVYRRVSGTTAYTLLATITDQVASYTYDDYMASSGITYDFVVAQVVDRYGSTVESVYAPVTATPISENYWLIHPDDKAKSIVLRNVTQDDPEEEYEQETYTIIGRGRKTDYGDRLGWRGALVAQLRDRNGVTARQQKIALLELKAELRDVYLRTPFGDVYRVAMGNVKISRIAGVGPSEFVDVEVPYEEVAE